MQKPWSVINDDELRLLRLLEKTIRFQGGVSAEVHLILGQLRASRGEARR
jgi:hypothetical protein